MFTYCRSLKEIYFRGNAPYEYSTFGIDDQAAVYYLPGTTGWGSAFAGCPTVRWDPELQRSDASFGVQADRFGFNIVGNSNLIVVVEACTDLANPSWSPVGTNTLTGGTAYFSDSEWTHSSSRFYRLRMP